MKPMYKCGYKVPTLFKFIIKLICILIATLLLTLLTANQVIRDKNFPVIIIYLCALLIMLTTIYSRLASSIFLFYNNFMLYKEKLTIYDRIRLILMSDDINQLENYLDKRNYVNISELKIIVDNVYYAKSNDCGITIKFQLIFNDNKVFNLHVVEDTKNDYQQFLSPFINYHVYINDPHDLINGLHQPLRLTDYFMNQKLN